MNVLANCKPEKVFEYFARLCSVPHGSGNTKQVSDLCAAFAKEHGLRYRQDKYNNVVIVKEASAGYESAPAVILQGHLDMVCAAEPDCGIDMARDGLRLRVDGDWLSAEGTSLGGTTASPSRSRWPSSRTTSLSTRRSRPCSRPTRRRAWTARSGLTCPT